MTDPRLLVPLHLLPPVSGAPVAYMCSECGDTLSEPACLDCKHHRLYNGAPVPCLDLSPPDVVNDFDVRLDAIEWAMHVVAVWYDLGTFTEDEVVLRREGGQLIWGAAWDAFGGAPVLWPDDPGYEPEDDNSNDQVRRIVAAILRKGRPGVAS